MNETAPAESHGFYTEDMTISVGPQHPSTHGVLRFVVKTDGEVISEAIPDVGYLPRSIEKIGAIRIRHVTMPGDLLADLLNRPMEVADVRNRLADHFAVGLDHKAQHTVRAGVLRPDADGHVFGVKAVALNRCSLAHMLLTE